MWDLRGLVIAITAVLSGVVLFTQVVFPQHHERGTPSAQAAQEGVQEDDDSTGVTVRENTTGDPYAKEQANNAVLRYEEERSNFLGLEHKLYFALGCRVFSSEAEFWGLFSREANIIGHHAIDSDITDTKINDYMALAKQRGLAQAEGGRACDYWHENPDAVSDIRQLAAIAQ